MPKLTEKAVDWIGQQKKDEPFFLYFPFTSPHAPIVPTKEFIGKSQANGYGDFMVQTDDDEANLASNYFLEEFSRQADIQSVMMRGGVTFGILAFLPQESRRCFRTHYAVFHPLPVN